METHPLTVAGGMVVFALMAGCTGSGHDNLATSGSSPNTTSTAGPSVQRANGSVILVSAEVDGVMEALLSGVIVRTEHGCFALTHDATDIPVLWPHGSALSGDGTSVDVPDFGTVAVGDEVWAGGGSIGPETDEPIMPALPEECEIRADTSVVALQTFLEGRPSDLPSPEPPN